MISSPGWAGRQWRTIALSLAAASRSASSWKGARSARRRRASSSSPMLTQTSVYRASAPAAAARGSSVSFTPCPSSSWYSGGAATTTSTPASSPAIAERAGDVVAVADVGEAQPLRSPKRSRMVSRSASAWQGWWSGVSPLTTGTSAACGQRGDDLVGAGADHDRVDVAGEDAGGVADRLAAGELHFVAAEDDRVGAELGDADVEGDPGPGRGLLEDQGDAATGERCRRRSARRRPAFSSAARSSSLPSSKAPSSSPVRKFNKGALRFACDQQARILRTVELTALGWNLFHGRDLPPDPKLRTWRSRLLRFDGATRPTSRSTATSPRSSRRCSPAPSGTWRCCRSARRASPSRWPAPAGPSGTGRSPRATRSAPCGDCSRARTPT